MTYKISAQLGLVDTFCEIANLSFQLKKAVIKLSQVQKHSKNKRRHIIPRRITD